jgi:hypothetical protein
MFEPGITQMIKSIGELGVLLTRIVSTHPIAYKTLGEQSNLVRNSENRDSLMKYKETIISCKITIL